MKDLYMIILGCNPPNRFVEQHDVFFGIANSIVALRQEMYDFWPEAGDKLHIDAYRTVRKVDKYAIRVVERAEGIDKTDLRLYFLNLGGYKPLDMEEYHYKQLVVASSIAEAIVIAKKNTFWKHHDSAHVDNKYGIDVDDAYLVEDMLPSEIKAKYSIKIENCPPDVEEDQLNIGYLKCSSLA